MNKLAIAKMVNVLAGTQGTVDSTENTQGYQTALVGFVDNAYKDIQTYRNNFKFMQASSQHALTSVLSTITETNMDHPRFILYNKKDLRFIPYEDWVRTTQRVSPPNIYTVNPATGQVTLNPLDGDYTVDLYYHRIPHVLTGNSSIPIIPERFHTLIVFKALIDLGGYLGSYDIIQNYANKYAIELGQMLRDQVPATVLRTAPFVQSDNWYF